MRFSLAPLLFLLVLSVSGCRQSSPRAETLTCPDLAFGRASAQPLDPVVVTGVPVPPITPAPPAPRKRFSSMPFRPPQRRFEKQPTRWRSLGSGVGVHYRFDNEAGLILGREVARYVRAHPERLAPAPPARVH